MRIIHVLRKPLSEGTVAANTLTHGTGGINIDASRIASDGSHTRRDTTRKQHDLSGGDRDSAGAGMFASGSTFTPTNHAAGRWPANVILQHLDGCRCDGVKKIKGSPKPYVRDTEVKNRLFGKGAGLQEKGYQTINYADTDGKETVANWICAEGCPVRALDEQSGTLTSGKPNGVRNTGGNLLAGGGNQHPLSGFGDTGGASRFFKQVGGKTE